MPKTNDAGSFAPLTRTSPPLRRAATVAARDVLAVRKGETALIVTNPKKDVLAIAQALYDAVQAAGGRPTLVVQPVKSLLDFAETGVLMALRSDPDIAVSVSHGKLGKDLFLLSKPIRHKGKRYDSYFTYLMGKKRTRAFWSPSVTTRMFVDTVPIDYEALRRNCKRLKAVLDKADKVRITAPSGTDIEMGLRGRKAFTDDGDFRKPGSGGNLPAGEVFISPELGASNGVIAFDGSISLDKGEVIIRRPIVCTVARGFVTAISGGPEAAKLRGAIARAEKLAREFARAGKIRPKAGPVYARNARNLGELGIGLNPNAKIVGMMLEDEKVFRTCHVAIGANYDEDAPALIHLDGLIKRPTITAFVGKKTRVLVKDGDVVG